MSTKVKRLSKRFVQRYYRFRMLLAWRVEDFCDWLAGRRIVPHRLKLRLQNYYPSGRWEDKRGLRDEYVAKIKTIVREATHDFVEDEWGEVLRRLGD